MGELRAVRDGKVFYVIPLVCYLVFFANTIQFGIVRTIPIFEVSIVVLAMCLFCSGRVFANQVMVFLFCLVFLSSLCAFFVNFDTYNLAAYTFFCFSTFIIYAAGAKHNEASGSYFLKVFIFFSLVFSVLSVIQGFSLYRFSGFFDNPNGMGRFAAWTALACLLYLCVVPSYLKTKFYIFINVVLLCLVLAFLLASNSRLSIGALILAAFSVYLLVSVRQLFLLRMNKASLYKAFLGVLAVSLGLLIYYKAGFFDSLLSKFLVTYERNDFSQGRFSRWEEAVPYLSWFGRGHEVYVNSTLSEVHSNYVAQALVYGLAPAFAIYSLLLYMYVRSSFLFVVTGVYGYLLSFGFFSFYFIYGVFETGFSILPVYLAVFFLGFSDRLLKIKHGMPKV